MVKKSARKKKSEKYSEKRLMALAVGIFVFAAIALSFVGVPDTVSITGEITADFLSGWESGNLDISIAKYLFFLLILGLIFSILRFTGFFNGLMCFILSTIVSFLSIAYVTPEELYAIVMTYSALGLTLMIFVPFIIFVLFSAMLLVPFSLKHRELTIYPDRGKTKMFQYLIVSALWLMYLGVLVYLAISWSDKISGAVVSIMAIVAIISMVLAFKPSWFAKVVSRSILHAERDRLLSVRERERLRLQHKKEVEDIQSGYTQP